MCKFVKIQYKLIISVNSVEIAMIEVSAAEHFTMLDEMSQFTEWV